MSGIMKPPNRNSNQRSAHIHGIPRNTMHTRRQDDHKRRLALGFARGMEGKPHWKIELEVRGRTELLCSLLVLGTSCGGDRPQTRVVTEP